jgi:hypothetical protein
VRLYVARILRAYTMGSIFGFNSGLSTGSFIRKLLDLSGFSPNPNLKA